MADVNSILVTDTEDTERESDLNQVRNIFIDIKFSLLHCHTDSQIINYNPSSNFLAESKKNTKFSLRRQKCLASPEDTNQKTFPRQEKITITTSDSETQN